MFNQSVTQKQKQLLSNSANVFQSGLRGGVWRYRLLLMKRPGLKPGSKSFWTFFKCVAAIKFTVSWCFSEKGHIFYFQYSLSLYALLENRH